MRLALVTQGYLEPGGGVTTIVNWLVEGLRNRGHSVDVHVMSRSRLDPSSRRLLAPTTWRRRTLETPVSVSPRISRWGTNLAELEPMRYMPRRELTAVLNDYDAVQLVCGTPALGYAVKNVSAPIVMQAATRARWERSLSPGTGRASEVLRRLNTAAVSALEDRAVSAASIVLVENSVMRDYVHSCGQRHVIVAMPGVDTDRFQPDVRGWQASGPIISVCRLGDPRKGMSRILRAYARLTSMMDQVPELLLVGRGALTSVENELVHTLAIDSRVRVYKDMPAAELPEALRKSSAFIQGSYEEGLGLSVMEAMASGVPTVSTESAGSAQLLAGTDAGVLVPQGDEEEVAIGLADGLFSVLTTSGAEMAAAARREALTRFASGVALDVFEGALRDAAGATN